MLTAPYAFGTHAFFCREGSTIDHAVASASRSLTSNVVTIVTATAHGLYTGAVVTTTGFTVATFNAASQTVTVVNSTTFTFPLTNADIADAADLGGTITQVGAVSSTNRPGHNDTGWIDVGVIEDAEDQPAEVQNVDIYAPLPGKLRKKDVIELKVTSSGGTLTCKEVSPLALSIIYRAGPLTSASTQFNRLEGGITKGWLKLQRYDQNDTQRLVEDVWCVLEVAGAVKMGNGLAEVQYKYDVLHSALNTGSIA